METKLKSSAGSRRLLILSGVLIVLIGIAALTGVFGGDVSTLDVPEVGVAADNVRSISVTTTGETMTLNLEGDSWRITEPIDFKADPSRVGNLLRALEDLELGSLVTENPDRYGVYGITDSTGSRVEVSLENGGKVELMLGGKSAAQRGDYVRLAGDKRVFKASPRVSVADELDLWRDKRIVAADAGSAVSVTVDHAGGSYTVSNENGWQFSDGTKADSAKVSQFLTRYANFRADAFVEGITAASVREASNQHVRLQGADGSMFDLYFQPMEDENVAVVTGKGDAVYRIRASRLDSMVPERSSLAD